MSYEYSMQRISSMPVEQDDEDEFLEDEFENQVDIGETYRNGDRTRNDHFSSGATSFDGSNELKDNRFLPVNQEISGADLKQQDLKPQELGISHKKKSMLNDAQLFSKLVDAKNMNDLPIKSNVGHIESLLVEQTSKPVKKDLVDHNNFVGSPNSFLERTSLLTKNLSLSETETLKEGVFEKIATAKLNDNLSFSIEFGSGRTVDVKANNLPDKWTIALMARDPEFKEKLLSSQADIEKNIRNDMGKSVEIQVK